VTKPKSTEPQVPAEEAESVDMSLLPEMVSPSAVKKRREIDSDTDEVSVHDSDEKSDWSEIKNLDPGFCNNLIPPLCPRSMCTADQ
jgi:hypothetical protein